MAVRVGVDLAVLDACGSQLLLVGAGATRGQIEHLHDRGPLGAGVAGVAAEHVIRGDPALSVGRPGKRHHRRRARDGVDHLRRVADRVDVRIGGELMGVHNDRAARRCLKPGQRGDAGVGGDSDRQHDQVRGQYPFGGQDRVRRESLSCGRQMQVDPVTSQFVLHLLCHFRVQRTQHLVGGLQQGDIPASISQGLGHLHADVTAADDHCATMTSIDDGLDRIHVVEVAQCVDGR